MPGHKHILLIGSADPQAGIPYQALSRRWYRVTIIPDGDQALQRLHQEPPDLVLLDATLSHSNPATICVALQDQDPPIPLILFTASETHARQWVQHCAAVPLWATLTKPCLPKELTATVGKLVRQVRRQRHTTPMLRAGPLVLDLAQRQATRDSQPLDLTPKQFDLLALLVHRAGQVVSRQTIMAEVWQTNWLGDTRTLDVHIRMIRRCIEDDPSRPQLVHTVRGRGYVFQVPEPASSES